MQESLQISERKFMAGVHQHCQYRGLGCKSLDDIRCIQEVAFELIGRFIFCATSLRESSSTAMAWRALQLFTSVVAHMQGASIRKETPKLRPRSLLLAGTTTWQQSSASGG